MKFFKVTVDCSSETTDAVAYALHELGSLGEVFDDYNDIMTALNEKRWDYADESLFTPTESCSVSGFFDTETNIEAVTEKIRKLTELDYADFSSISVAVEVIDSVEWENEWKKYYKPFNIGKLVIIPEWIERKAVGGEIPVKLNPGLAFGTGTHETTSMCIDLMQRLDIAGKRVLDFGCGSGILGICASKLGAADVLFADTDEQAIAATLYNCGLNRITSPNVLCDDVRNIEMPADIVLANITADVLIDVEPLIKRSLKKGGYAVISGIISQKADEVKAVYANDFKYIDGEQKNEWSAYIFQL